LYGASKSSKEALSERQRLLVINELGLGAGSNAHETAADQELPRRIGFAGKSATRSSAMSSSVTYFKQTNLAPGSGQNPTKGKQKEKNKNKNKSDIAPSDKLVDHPVPQNGIQRDASGPKKIGKLARLKAKNSASNPPPPPTTST
jgi:hypothetical protein